MIYTGYYAKLKEYEKNGLYPIAISGKAPDFYTKACWPDFAPRIGMFLEWKAGRIDNSQYTVEYKEWLDTLDKQEIKDVIKELEDEGKTIIFLCYEKSGEFCHRHVLADWLEANFGVRVDEYLFN